MELDKQAPMTHLEAAEAALRYADRPLTAKQIVAIIVQLDISKISGITPYKTINARLAEDIQLKGDKSIFARTAQGRFSIRGIGWEPEVTVKARSSSRFDEEIKAIQLSDLEAMINDSDGELSLQKLDRTRVVSEASSYLRSEAEERFDIVQIIPSFVICKGNEVLSFQRTKKLPEARLHNSKSINFGGHLQSDDFPELFSNSQKIVDLFLMRELYEELRFSKDPDVNYIGALYLKNTPFERQHIGLVYLVNIPIDTKVYSQEPGYHTNLNFEELQHLCNNITELDSWSQLLAKKVKEINGG